MKTIHFGKIEQVTLVPIYEPEWALYIAICRRYFPILANWKITPVLSYSRERITADPLSVDGCELDTRKILLYPLSLQAAEYLRNIHSGSRTRAIRHYVCHELGHAAFFAVTGHKHATIGDPGEMVDRYEREEKSVDELAFFLAQLGTIDEPRSAAMEATK